MPAVALAPLLLHALYKKYSCTVASSSKFGKATVAMGRACIVSALKTAAMVKESRLVAVPYIAPCSGHDCSNKECCCSFGFVGWLKHCNISLTRKAAAA